MQWFMNTYEFSTYMQTEISVDVSFKLEKT